MVQRQRVEIGQRRGQCGTIAIEFGERGLRRDPAFAADRIAPCRACQSGRRSWPLSRNRRSSCLPSCEARGSAASIVGSGSDSAITTSGSASLRVSIARGSSDGKRPALCAAQPLAANATSKQAKRARGEGRVHRALLYADENHRATHLRARQDASNSASPCTHSSAG